MIGERLKKLRKEKKLTQLEFAKAIGVAESTMSLYENNKRQPDYVTLSKLADYYNVSVDYLLGRVNNPGIKIISKEDLPEELAKYVDYIEILKEVDMSDISPEGLKKLIQAAKELENK